MRRSRYPNVTIKTLSVEFLMLSLVEGFTNVLWSVILLGVRMEGLDVRLFS